ncbi:MAG: ABC transporter substrate-binding protein [Pseudomonadota bacterium]
MPVTLIENFRAAFYAPFYAAFALGAYKSEDVDVRLEMSAAADKTLTGLLTGTGNVSWGGPMRLMRALDENPKSDLVGFCEVVGRDPFYLLGCKPNVDFRMNDLAGKTLAVVSEVPTPWYCLQHDLRLAGIDPAAIRRAPARSMGENLELLRAGKVDVIQVFEPLAQKAVDQGIGHIWHAAASRGPASYTTLNTTRSFLERDPDTALRMTRAIYRTQKWIAAHDGRELAEAIASYLPDITLKTLAACCNGYKESGVWNTNPIQQRAGLEWLRDAMLACNAIRTKFAYEDLADMRFAEQVIRESPPSI